MKKTIVIATRNRHKLEEIAIILGDAYHLLSTDSFPGIPEIEETEDTFAGNALLKAQAVYEVCGKLTLADDSGLEVFALDNAPGIYSARYAGEAGDHVANNRKLLQALEGVPSGQRGARFRCTVAIVGPQMRQVVEGSIDGVVREGLSGKAGFGYDPLFQPDGYAITFADMDPVEKNSISHRARAFAKAREVLEA